MKFEYEQTNMNKYENIIDLHAPVRSGEFLPMARSLNVGRHGTCLFSSVYEGNYHGTRCKRDFN